LLLLFVFFGCEPGTVSEIQEGDASTDGSISQQDGGVITESDPAPDAGLDPDVDTDVDAGPDMDAGQDAGTDASPDQDTLPDTDGRDPSFVCLETAGDIRIVSGHHEEKYEPSTAPGLAFDARDADFLIHQVKWGMVVVEGSNDHTGMCWAGGFIQSNKPWDATWDDHKDLDGPTRNSAAIHNHSTGMVVSGVHYFNVHDGDRTTDAVDWIIQHSWGDYVRDDCIENDDLRSGLVYDTLWDGCYTGISTRPSSGDDSTEGAGELVELDHVLLRLQPMPYPYKWESKPGILDENGEPWDGTGVPYGHGNFFKMTDESRNPDFAIRNSVFMATHFTTAKKLDFPPESLMRACENNTIVWLGPGDYPGTLPTGKFPGCFTILTGQAGHDFWRQKVTDWHARHPGVGAHRKPAQPGSLEFPEVF
jgi:hypothetical protein